MRKRENLIPFEKSKKVIQLDRRGLVKKKKPIGAIIWGALGVLCLVYCLVIWLFMGYGTHFFLVWGALAVFCGLLSFVLAHERWMEKLPKWLKGVCVILFLAGLILFGTVEVKILGSFQAQPSAGADYCIILGAQWKTSGPSYILQLRLDAALRYLKENPETIVIVSGGQGATEPVSEAEGMKGYLIDAGIAEERILMEDTSTNTISNLLNSAELLDRENDRVVLVTNNFHMYRACSIARKQGYQHLEGLAADSHMGMLPNNLLREFFGVIKDTAAGNM
ncbi:MAG: YdcF family protein [Candidatus Gastranaerophilales bacterium]|nr:YdcF family protein [Candidatus Gastranaerophilales bacterium]